MGFKFNATTGKLDLVREEFDTDKIVTATITVDTIDNENYTSDDIQLIVIDNDGNIITE